MRAGLLVGLTLALATTAALAATGLAGPPDDAELVRDINPSGASKPDELTVVGGRVYFAADGPDGRELWRSDGTEAGTDQVRDINPSGDGDPENLANVGGTLFFAATDSSGDTELWKSNGTNSGTVRVADINVGGDSNPSDLTDLGGILVFDASDGSGAGEHGRELWRSDGTPGGTELVKDVNSGPSGGSVSGLAAIGDTLYFAAGKNGTDIEPWISDGTELGTIELKDINTSMATASSHPSEFTGIAGMVVFAAYGSSVTSGGATGATQDRELWRTDGTEAGTQVVTDIVAGNGSSDPVELTSIGDTVVFRACGTFNNSSCGNAEPWVSDGTPAGTMQLAEIRPANAGSDPSNLTRVGGNVFFGATDGTGSGLWKTDGTPGGTVRVKEGVQLLNQGVDFDGNLVSGFFDNVDAELWRSDGTDAGTVPIEDINPGPGNFSYPFSPDGYDPVVLGEMVIFRADDGTDGVELWKAADTIPPNTTIDSGPSGGASIADRTPTHTFASDDSPSSFECRIHPTGAAPGVFHACTGPGASNTPGAPLADGGYTVEVRATDAAGNTDATPATGSFVVDGKAPGAVIALRRKFKLRGKQFEGRVSILADEDLTALAGGSVFFGSPGRSAARFREIEFAPAAALIPVGGRAVLRLKLEGGKKKRRGLSKKLKRTLLKGRKARLRVTVTLTDSAGNTSTEAQVARLKLRKRRRS